jgi:glycosyltransferase involved in cell wall biosynthesis
MPTALPISCFIIAKDEANRIDRAISSVLNWVDEVVVVVDASSSDDTQSVARRLGARVVENAWPGYGAQKRFAEDLCRNQWLLNLDADEAVTPPLEKEIRALFARGEPVAGGYRIFIAEVLSFEDNPARWGHGLWQIRLYDRRKGRFSESPVHDTVRYAENVKLGKLKCHIAHRSNLSLSFAIAKWNLYTDAQVADLRARGRRFGRSRLVTEFPIAFLKAYFLRRYFVRGWWGWTSAVDYAYFRHMRVVKAYEAELLENATSAQHAQLTTTRESR